jgi:hypothetical protein
MDAAELELLRLARCRLALSCCHEEGLERWIFVETVLCEVLVRACMRPR